MKSLDVIRSGINFGRFVSSSSSRRRVMCRLIVGLVLIVFLLRQLRVDDPTLSRTKVETMMMIRSEETKRGKCEYRRLEMGSRRSEVKACESSSKMVMLMGLGGSGSRYVKSSIVAKRTFKK